MDERQVELFLEKLDIMNSHLDRIANCLEYTSFVQELKPEEPECVCDTHKANQNTVG
jgi:hypothetical protein